MHKKGVLCMDCHMPHVPDDGTPATPDGLHVSHTFKVYAEYSCGLDRVGCHPNHDEDWAQKQIDKGIHDKGSYGQIKEKK
jgi:formate-dependent nitrite reductase cytochrome c552 subunit